jgi:hypothetical protein
MITSRDLFDQCDMIVTILINLCGVFKACDASVCGSLFASSITTTLSSLALIVFDLYTNLYIGLFYWLHLRLTRFHMILMFITNSIWSPLLYVSNATDLFNSTTVFTISHTMCLFSWSSLHRTDGAKAHEYCFVISNREVFMSFVSEASLHVFRIHCLNKTFSLLLLFKIKYLVSKMYRYILYTSHDKTNSFLFFVFIRFYSSFLFVFIRFYSSNQTSSDRWLPWYQINWI